MKNRLFLVISAIFLLSSNPAQGMAAFSDQTEQTFNVCTAYVAALGLHKIYTYFTTPDRRYPTLSELKPVTIIPKPLTKDAKELKEFSKPLATKIFKNTDIKAQLKLSDQGKFMDISSGISKELAAHDVVYVFAGGYLTNYYIELSNARGYSAAVFLKNKLIQGPVVTFNCASDYRASFNFGQEQDISSVETIYEEILKIKPDIKVVLMGTCKGAALMLRFLEKHADNPEYTQNIAAVITESPPISPKRALEHGCTQRLSHRLACHLLPNYDHKAPRITDAKQFPSIPLLLGCLTTDTICSMQQIKETLSSLAGHCKCPTIHTFVSDRRDIIHGKLGTDPKFQDSIRKFIAHYVHNQLDISFVNEQLATTQKLCLE